MPKGLFTAQEIAFRRAHEALTHDPTYQLSLPPYKAPEPPPWLLAFKHFLEVYWTYIKWITLVVAAILLCFALYSLVRAYWPRFWKRVAEPDSAKPETAVWAPSPKQARELLREADALAANGLYSEAVHLLLLRSIEDIHAQRPNLVRPTLTSREIEKLQSIPDRARLIFGNIANAVERSLFAGLDIDAAEFSRCRAEYEAFAFAPTWQGSH